MTARWDVRTPSGALVDNLDALGEVLGGVTREMAAKMLLAEPAADDLAPAALLTEAKHAVQQVETKKAQGTHKPGGGTPPPISNGTFVQFGSTRGRVDLVVTNGKVPGVDDDVEGSKDSPAVRVVVWDKDGDSYKPSRRKVGKAAHTLKRIPPLTRMGKKSAGVDLVGMLAAHEGRGLPGHAHVTGASVKAVYDRGMAAWPGYERTTLTPEQWAAGRVKAFLAVAAGDESGDRSRDLGLLSKSHPRNPQYQPGDTIEVKAVDIERDLAMFEDA